MKYYFILILSLFFIDLHAQKNEVSASYSNGISSQGIGIHYLRDKSHDRWAQGDYKFGFGIEKSIGKENHSSFGLIVNTRILNQISMGLSPRIIFLENGYEWGFHMEYLYEIKLNRLCLGPCVQVSVEKEDYHIGMGIHLGFDF